MNLNKILLIGHVGRDPETIAGDFVKFSLATTERGYEKDGVQIPDRTTWHDIEARGQQARFAQNYIKQGDMVFVEGKLYKQDVMTSGGQRTYTKVYAYTIELIKKKESTNLTT